MWGEGGYTHRKGRERTHSRGRKNSALLPSTLGEISFATPKKSRLPQEKGKGTEQALRPKRGSGYYLRRRTDSGWCPSLLTGGEGSRKNDGPSLESTRIRPSEAKRGNKIVATEKGEKGRQQWAWLPSEKIFPKGPSDWGSKLQEWESRGRNSL